MSMLQKALTEEEMFQIVMENALEEGQDLRAFQNILFSVIKRVYHKGMELHCWQGSQEFARFTGRGFHNLQPHQPAAPQAEQAPQPQALPTQPGPQPIQPGRPLPDMPAGVPGRSLPAHAVPREAPTYPGLPPTAPTAPPAMQPAPAPPQQPPGPPVAHPQMPFNQPAMPSPTPPPTPPPEAPSIPEMPTRG
jgi:hypothetical protein